MEWTLDEEDAATHEMITTMGANVKTIAKEQNAFFDYQFMNDASYVQRPLESYGPASLAIMRAVSTAYDLGQVFQRLQNSGFLLSYLDALGLVEMGGSLLQLDGIIELLPVVVYPKYL